MNIQGKKFSNYMTFREWRLFIKNYNNGNKDKRRNPIRDYLVRFHDDFHQFIGDAFIWSKTPEGHEFWKGIANRTYEIRD